MSFNQGPGPLFSKHQDVLPPRLGKFWTHEIWIYISLFSLKYVYQKSCNNASGTCPSATLFSILNLSIVVTKICHDSCKCKDYNPSHKCRFLSQWRHNELDSVSNHLDGLLNRLFRHWSKKTSKLRVTGLCAGNSPMTGQFPAQKASDAENISIWWRHHVQSNLTDITCRTSSLYIYHDTI